MRFRTCSYSYSNDGYTLLAAIVESASGQKFQSFLREQLFDPLGMTSTGFYGDRERWPSGTVASSYFETAVEGCPTDWPLTWSATGNGHVITTLPDLVRWENELRAGELLSAQAKHKLFSPYTATGGAFDYGYGWYVGKAGRPSQLCFHPGYYRSFGSEYRRYVDDEVMTFVMSNQGYLGGTGQHVALADPISDIALGRPPSFPPAAIALDGERAAACCGTFQLPSGSRLEFQVRDGHLWVEAVGQDAFDLFVAPDAQRSQTYARLDEQAKLMVEATKAGDRDALRKSLSATDADLYAQAMDSGWSSLVKQFGAFRRFEVLGTSTYPSTDDWLRTFVRLEFERAKVVITFGYRNGAFFDLSTWEGVANPGALVIAPLSESEYATYDLWTGKGIKMRFRADPDGKVTEVRFDDKDLSAKKLD